MKQIVLSISEESDHRLRRIAEKTYQGKKGALSHTVEEALWRFEKELRQKTALRKLQKLANHDKKYGVKKFERAKAYD